MHVPVPLQVEAGVSVSPLQLGELQVTVVGASSQTPPAAQLPVLPHVPLGWH